MNLYSLTFDDFSLESDDMMLAAVSMFLDLGLVKKFNIEKEVSFIRLPCPSFWLRQHIHHKYSKDMDWCSRDVTKEVNLELNSEKIK
jgi:hypothetical protein